jgi:hypothetical protein
MEFSLKMVGQTIGTAGVLVDGNRIVSDDGHVWHVTDVRHEQAEYIRGDSPEAEENREQLADHYEDIQHLDRFYRPDFDGWSYWVKLDLYNPVLEETVSLPALPDTALFRTLQTEHYASCGTCRRVWPCQEHVIETAAAQIDDDLQKLGDACNHCGSFGRLIMFSDGARYHYSQRSHPQCRQAADTHAARHGLKIRVRAGVIELLPAGD